MFEIPVGDLLASYSGDSKDLEFDGLVYDGYYEDLQFIGNLYLKIKIIGLDDGVTVIIEKLKAQIKYQDLMRFIEIEDISRDFKEKFRLENPDDIKYIGNNSTIDLHDIIREEILIQCID